MCFYWVYEMQTAWLFIPSFIKGTLVPLSVCWLTFCALPELDTGDATHVATITSFLLTFLTVLRHLILRVHYRWGRMFASHWAWQKTPISWHWLPVVMCCERPWGCPGFGQRQSLGWMMKAAVCTWRGNGGICSLCLITFSSVKL